MLLRKDLNNKDNRKIDAHENDECHLLAALCTFQGTTFIEGMTVKSLVDDADVAPPIMSKNHGLASINVSGAPSNITERRGAIKPFVGALQQ